MKQLTALECNAISGGAGSPPALDHNLDAGSAAAQLGTEIYNEYKDHRWSKTAKAIGNLINDAAAKNPPREAGFDGKFSPGGHFVGGR
ncbi:hypothetical protein F9C28_17400 [Shimwellia pseudoproteus]|uniref:hypothetical protein n=1 Tax=Shimwellia pseudoproteus TaxID=570012 RepID=UPI0018EC7F60|nr:hypothetical protein [Shimwellia pseudoproteus]MBJ3816639.1 hypothetical protein [Shimwellia pseudoproteus]